AGRLAGRGARPAVRLAGRDARHASEDRGERAGMSGERTVMRAAVITGPGRVRVTHLARPTPGAGEVLVRIEGCGVCGSNAPVWEGRSWFEYPQPPGAPGHEGWGRIEEVGPGVAGLAAGQRIALLSYHAFAEYDVAAADAVVPLPPSLGELP